MPLFQKSQPVRYRVQTRHTNNPWKGVRGKTDYDEFGAAVRDAELLSRDANGFEFVRVIQLPSYRQLVEFAVGHVPYALVISGETVQVVQQPVEWSVENAVRAAQAATVSAQAAAEAAASRVRLALDYMQETLGEVRELRAEVRPSIDTLADTAIATAGDLTALDLAGLVNEIREARRIDVCGDSCGSLDINTCAICYYDATYHEPPSAAGGYPNISDADDLPPAAEPAGRAARRIRIQDE